MVEVKEVEAFYNGILNSIKEHRICEIGYEDKDDSIINLCNSGLDGDCKDE